MTTQQDKNDPRLEAMLRRWGAEKAAGQADIGAAPAVARRRSLWRWLPLTAAAAMLVAAVGFFLAAQEKANRQPAQAAGSQEKIEALQGELATAKKQVAWLTAASQPGARPDQQEVQRLHQQLAAAVQIQQSQAKDLSEKQRQLETLGKQLEQAQVNIVKIVSVAKLDQEQLAAARQQLQDQQRQAQQDLAAVRARQAGLLDSFGSAYLSALAPGEKGVAAAQTAMRKAQLLQRLPAVAKRAKTQPGKAALDRVEAALTELDMIKSPASEGEKFSAATKKAGVLAAIDKALDEQEDPAVAAFLLEARCVLAGAQHAA